MAYPGNLKNVTLAVETVGATSGQLSNVPGRSVLFQNDAGSAGPVYISKGAAAVIATNTWRLQAGVSLEVPLPCGNLNEFYAISDGAGRTLRCIVLS